jgi:hypothetical protein
MAIPPIPGPTMQAFSVPSTLKAILETATRAAHEADPKAAAHELRLLAVAAWQLAQIFDPQEKP